MFLLRIDAAALQRGRRAIFFFLFLKGEHFNNRNSTQFSNSSSFEGIDWPFSKILFDIRWIIVDIAAASYAAITYELNKVLPLGVDPSDGRVEENT